MQTLPAAMQLRLIMKRTNGVTLVELMVVLAIAAILLTAAVPSMQSFILNRQSDRLTQELQLDLSYARNHAITKATTVTVAPLNGNWSTGWTIQQGATILRQRGEVGRPIADNGVITSTFTQALPLRFDAQGRAVNAGINNIGTINIDVPGCVGRKERTISINFIGQVVIQEANCS